MTAPVIRVSFDPGEELVMLKCLVADLTLERNALARELAKRIDAKSAAAGNDLLVTAPALLDATATGRPVDDITGYKRPAPISRPRCEPPDVNETA